MFWIPKGAKSREHPERRICLPDGFEGLFRSPNFDRRLRRLLLVRRRLARTVLLLPRSLGPALFLFFTPVRCRRPGVRPVDDLVNFVVRLRPFINFPLPRLPTISRPLPSEAAADFIRLDLLLAARR